MTHSSMTKILNTPSLFVIDDFKNKKKKMKQNLTTQSELNQKPGIYPKTPKAWITDKIFVLNCTPHWSSESVIPQGAFDKVLREWGKFVPQVSDSLFRLSLIRTDKIKFQSTWWRIETFVKDKITFLYCIYKRKRRWAVMVRLFGTLNQSMNNTN